MKIKKNESAQDFIKDLSAQLEPVNVNWKPRTRTLTWVAFNLSFSFFIMLMIGDFPFQAQLQGWRILEFVIGIFSIFSLSYFAFLGLVPGASSEKTLKLSFIPLLAFVSIFIYALTSGLEAPAPGIKRWHCNLEIILISFIPAIQFFYLTYKDLLFSNKMSFLLSGFASSLVPAFIMNYICSFDPMHVLMHHFGPAIFFGLLFAGVLIKMRNKKRTE